MYDAKIWLLAWAIVESSAVGAMVSKERGADSVMFSMVSELSDAVSCPTHRELEVGLSKG